MKLEIPSAEPKDLATLHRWLLEAFRRSGDSYGGRIIRRVDVGTTETKIAHGLTERPLTVFWSQDGVTRVGRTRSDDSRFIYLQASTATKVDILVIPGTAGAGNVLDIVDESNAVVAVDSVASSEGSIFSMIGPLGSAPPVVAYDFTLYDPTLTVAQNLINANQSGNANLDLVVAAGGARIAYQSAEVTSGFSASYGVAPVGGRVDGGILWSGRAEYVKGSAAELVFVGAMTAEWMGYIPRPPTAAAGELYLFGYGGGGGAEVNNTTWYLVCGDGAGAADFWYYTHQTGIRVSVRQLLTYSPPTDFPPPHGIPLHLVLTRSASGSIQFYMQGRLARSAVTLFPALPTGGTSGSLEIGYGDTNVDLATLAVRLFNVELTPAQVRESYTRAMYGLSL